MPIAIFIEVIIIKAIKRYIAILIIFIIKDFAIVIPIKAIFKLF